MSADKPDDCFVRGVNAKSLAAWEELYAGYYAALCSYAERIVKRADVAEDIVQEMLLVIWRSDRMFASVRELSFFLYKAAYLNSLYYLRTTRTRANILELMAGDAAQADEAQFADSIREELLRKLHLHIESLPAERRRIILLGIEGYGREQIAQMLGISPNTVRTQKSHAIRTLREKLNNSPLIFLL